MTTKVIAFDVYGTILMTSDHDNCVPFRNGFVQFAKSCISKGIILVTSSDNDIPFTKNDLSMSGVPLELFFDFYQMNKSAPKDFSVILNSFDLDAAELHVFGDMPEYDINPALELGCKATLVPAFESLKDNFDWMSLDGLIT